MILMDIEKSCSRTPFSYHSLKKATFREFLCIFPVSSCKYIQIRIYMLPFFFFYAEKDTY